MPISSVTPLQPAPPVLDDPWRRSDFKTRVGSIMVVRVLTCDPRDSLNRAARLLRDHDCGALPVLSSDGKLVGMITTREIWMAAYLERCTQPTGIVASALSSRVLACDVEDTIERVLELMRAHQLRRLPVVHSDGRFAGLVSLADISHHLSSFSRGVPQDVCPT
jgi:CBS domain-containing protein